MKKRTRKGFVEIESGSDGSGCANKAGIVIIRKA